MANHAKYIPAGIAIGLLIGLCALASGDSPNQATARIFDILEKPVSLLADSIGCWLLFHFAYWMLIGGLFGWLIAVLKSKFIDGN